MKTALFSAALITLGVQVQAHAKTLNVACKDSEGRTVELVSQIANVASPQTIQSLIYNGKPVASFNDVSSLPIYANGVITLQINVGYSSISMSLKNCEDSFLAQGDGELKRYVGGFAGTALSSLKCSCDLK